MQNITLTLSLDEVNVILEALGQQPYVSVSQVIATIQEQASAQLQQNSDTQQADSKPTGEVR